MDNDHSFFMEMALAEARKGLGRTSPNPAVGAVIVKDSVVVGKGYHKKAGTPHAEVHAIADAGPLAHKATLYVTLEPCNHTGKTPPCTESIFRAGIDRVVIGMADPNPRVTGGGASALMGRGIAVLSGVLEQQCRELNYPFLKHSTSGLPWIIMKAGLSLDGKIAYYPHKGGTVTGPDSSRHVHRLRNRVDAILIGVETAIIDDPRLTARLADEESRDPVRIVLDSSLRLPTTSRMLAQDSAAETWVICVENASWDRERSLADHGAKVVRLEADVEGRVDLQSLLTLLGDKGLTSVLVEGGARIHGAFYRQQLVDELHLLYAPFIIGDNGTSLVRGYQLDSREQAPVLSNVSCEILGSDVLLKGLVQPTPLFTG